MPGILHPLKIQNCCPEHLNFLQNLERSSYRALSMVGTRHVRVFVYDHDGGGAIGAPGTVRAAHTPAPVGQDDYVLSRVRIRRRLGRGLLIGLAEYEPHGHPVDRRHDGEVYDASDQDLLGDG